MDDFDLFLQLPITAQAAAICFVACSSCLFALLIASPQRDCFFFRWTAEKRLLALLVAPTLLILWPIVIYAWFLQSRGIDPDDLDYFDED
jgi:hypothetical protein